MKFLIDPITDHTIFYDQLAHDLQARRSPEQTSSLAGLYKTVVNHLKELIVADPSINWDSENSAFDDPQQLQHWRQQFLSSQKQIPIHTSGSSGLAKQVWHSIDSLTRGVRLDQKHRNDVWGLTYPLDHLAGIQVLFQAVLNFNPVVCLYQQPSEILHQAIDRYAITHLSCTPTLLRMLLADRQVHASLQRLTCGGEKLDSNLLTDAQRMFPQARFTNIYAATETGTLLVSSDDQFTIPLSMSGMFRVIDGELWLHRSLRLTGDHAGDVGSTTACPLSAENRLPQPLPHPSPGSHDDSADKDQEFWSTGDLVEVLATNPLTIRFVGRRHEWFNVAGFRVDPTKLELVANRCPKIAQSRFYPIANSITENLIGCELVLNAESAEFDLNEWKIWFAQQVERQEMPRFIQIVDRISTTDSGKARRS